MINGVIHYRGYTLRFFRNSNKLTSVNISIFNSTTHESIVVENVAEWDVRHFIVGFLLNGEDYSEYNAEAIQENIKMAADRDCIDSEDFNIVP